MGAYTVPIVVVKPERTMSSGLLSPPAFADTQSQPDDYKLSLTMTPPLIGSPTTSELSLSPYGRPIVPYGRPVSALQPSQSFILPSTARLERSRQSSFLKVVPSTKSTTTTTTTTTTTMREEMAETQISLRRENTPIAPWAPGRSNSDLSTLIALCQDH